mgnify:CR=1 FL=1
MEDSFPHAVCISALTKENLTGLIEKISEVLTPNTMEIDVKIPLNRMDLVNLVHKQGQVRSIEYLSDSIHICATVSAKTAGKFNQF